MFRRLISSAVVVTLAGTALVAAERATFILTDGERKSGSIVFHGDQHENLINGFLNLGVDNAKDMTFPMDQVAVIDFIGGQPPTTELAQLGSGHMLVMRNGSAQQGRLLNMTGGDTLFWENTSKQRQQFAIRDVSRVYLNPQSARNTFGYVVPATPAPTPSAQEPAGRGDQRGPATRGGQRDGDRQGFSSRDDQRADSPNARGVSVRVDPRAGWTDSGVTVNRGDRLIFEVGDRTRGLLGRIGNGDVFSVGSEREPVLMRQTGRLMLSVRTDGRRGDTNPFSVIVSRP